MEGTNSTADIAVVGAGIIGLAVARALLRSNPSKRLVVLDKEHAPALHQTGRNSGVIHSGVFYAPGSLKAELCVQGAAALRQFCEQHAIETKACGKVIVANGEADERRLEELHRRGTASGVVGLELIGPQRLREIEPHAAGSRALHVPGTGIVDFGLVAAALAGEIRQAGGELRLGFEVTAIRERDGVTLVSTAGEVHARNVIFCAGVYADRLARLGGGDREPRIVPFRGSYFILKPQARHLANALIYPVPDPAFPFLGIHTTLRMDGSMWLGPNAVLALGRESYSHLDVRPSDVIETMRSRGFRRLARKNLRLGVEEFVRDTNRRLFVGSAQRLLPELRTDDVERGPAGIRAQALNVDGSLVDDFVLERRQGVVHVRNAPSPGATSSLKIGERIAGMAAEAFQL